MLQKNSQKNYLQAIDTDRLISIYVCIAQDYVRMPCELLLASGAICGAMVDGSGSGVVEAGSPTVWSLELFIAQTEDRCALVY